MSRHREPSRRHHALQHRSEIGPVGANRRACDVGEMRTIRVEHVVVPVRLEQTAVGGEVAAVGGDGIGSGEECEKVWKEIDQHQQPGRGWEALADRRAE